MDQRSQPRVLGQTTSQRCQTRELEGSDQYVRALVDSLVAVYVRGVTTKIGANGCDHFGCVNETRRGTTESPPVSESCAVVPRTHRFHGMSYITFASERGSERPPAAAPERAESEGGRRRDQVGELRSQASGSQGTPAIRLSTTFDNSQSRQTASWRNERGFVASRGTAF